LEPYGVRVMLQPASGELEPQEFLVAFLQDLAVACLASGASVIGHLKCLLHMPGHAVSCNLTSLREGARCSVRSAPGAVQGHHSGATSAPGTLKPGHEARLDLAVLVYGLPAATVGVLTRAALSRLLGPLGVQWSIPAFDPADFETFYPGVYGGREAEVFKQYLADNRALEERGEIDTEALATGTLPAETPGLGPKLEVTEAMVRYNNTKYDPDNPVLNDADYARWLGQKNILAMPCYGAHDDTFMLPYPPDARDTLLVSQLNHSVTNYAPVYPGDTLYLINNRRSVIDRTPVEGSVYRHVTIVSWGSAYNQRGEKINDTVWRVTESLKSYKEGKRPEKMGFAEIWEAPDWMARPAHVYTDADWGFIRGVWAAEERRGAEPLFWEDVKIGDRPALTVDGPIDESVAPSAPYGMGIRGSRTLRRETMDPAVFATMIRGERDGIYRLPAREDCVPPVPDGVVPFFQVDPEGVELGRVVDTRDVHKVGPDRAILVNFLGRDLALRHIDNWMGDHGWVRNIRWGIMPAEALAAVGKIVPKDTGVEYFLGKVPFMAGKHALAHGLTGDLAVVKSYVYDKSVRDGEFLVDLAWWIETIESDIWQEGGATVKLPSARAAKP
jgi:hypothetical protein